MPRSAVFFCLFCVATLDAAAPTVRNVNVRGLQVGGTTTITIDGDDLGKTPRLLLPFAAQQKLKPGSTDKLASFEVMLDTTVQPGFSHLRLVTEGGVSAPVVIGLDKLPQLPLAAATDQVPVALHGTVSGSATSETKFPGKAGQKILVEVEAQRIGSKLRPILHLYNSRRLQLAWSWSTPALFGDTRLEATLPEDGLYTVTLHDSEYAGPAPGHFRLKIGQWSYVDQVFPPVVGKDSKAVELVGSSPVARIDLPAAGNASLLPLTWPAGATWSGPRPFVTMSAHTEVVEQIAEAKIQDLPAGPVGVSGRLAKPFEEDRYRVPVKPSSRVRFEVFAERLGSPLDVALALRNDAGADLARAEDSAGTLDPVLEYAVPANVSSVVVAVVDAQGRGGPRGVYRLVIDPREPSAVKPDFHLNTPTQNIVLPVGGRSVVPVFVERRGYRGLVTLAADSLPAGVKLEGNAIPPEADGALVTVQRADSPGDAAITTWRGKSDDGQERVVSLKGHPLERLQPWLATELAVAPSTAKAADFQIDWRGLTADKGIVPTVKLALPVKVTRPAMPPSLVRLTLVTSQSPPLVNGQPDPNQSLRPERPVELADKVADGEVAMLVPAQLASPMYDVAIQAELLTPDRRTVLATAFTPVRRMSVRLPVVLVPDGTPRIEAKLDAKTGATIEIKGKIERQEGFAGDVALTLSGLPAGGRADPVSVKAGVNTFAVKVILPPTVPAGEVKGLKLGATVAPNAAQPNVRVKSRDVDLTLVVQAAK